MRTVLYVEDDGDDRKLMMIAVTQRKPQFELRLQNDYHKVVDYLSNRGLFDDRRYFPPPDLVLLNYSLGTFKGTELLSWIRTRSELQTLPVVIVSANRDEQIVARCYAMGANYFIAKSAQTNEWLRLVNSLDACLQTIPPRMEELEELATSPALSLWSSRREARENPAENGASVFTAINAEGARAKCVSAGG